jgi:hypothetical protein
MHPSCGRIFEKSASDSGENDYGQPMAAKTVMFAQSI